jgi:hypothetical protein
MYPNLNQQGSYYTVQPQHQMNIQESQPLMTHLYQQQPQHQPQVVVQQQQQVQPGQQYYPLIQPKVQLRSVQQEYIAPTQQQPIVTQRELKFEEAVLQTVKPMGSVNQKTGKLTFTSSNFILKLLLIVFIIYGAVIAISFFVATSNIRKNTLWPIGFVFVIPSFLLGLIAFFSRVYTVEFDDVYKQIVMKSNFRYFGCCCACFGHERVISYNSIEDIHVEFFKGYKSQIVMTTTEQEKIVLLSRQCGARFGLGSGYNIFQNQAIVQEMRKHLVRVTKA